MISSEMKSDIDLIVSDINNNRCFERRVVGVNYALNITIIDYDKPIIFTFDNMDTTIDDEENLYNRKGWGHEFVLKLGYNVCSFLENDVFRWYRRKEFFEIIEYVSKSDVFKCFPARFSYGSSMGGFAATFSKVLSCDKVLLINPISTLNEQKSRFETRFSGVRSMNDWEDCYHDAVEGLEDIAGYIIYDPLFSLDSSHAKRFLQNNPNLKEIRVFGFGHGLPWHLKSLGLLKETVSKIFSHDFESYRSSFYHVLRNRKVHKRYFNFLLSKDNSHLTIHRQNVILKNAIVSLSERYPKEADFFRELCDLFDNVDKDLSLVFIKRAFKARPHGKYIKNRLDELISD